MPVCFRVWTFKTPEMTFRASEKNDTLFFCLVYFFLKIEHGCQELTCTSHRTTFIDIWPYSIYSIYLFFTYITYVPHMIFVYRSMKCFFSTWLHWKAYKLIRYLVHILLDPIEIWCARSTYRPHDLIIMKKGPPTNIDRLVGGGNYWQNIFTIQKV